MLSKSLAIGALAAGCVAAVAGGAYVAVRHNTSPAPAVVSAPAPPAVSAEAPRAVAETEAVVTTPAPVQVKSELTPATPERAQRSAAETAPVPNRARVNTRRPDAVPSRAPSSAAVARAQEAPREQATPAQTREVREATADGSSTPQVQVPNRTGSEVPAHPEAPLAPQPQLEQIVVPASSVIGLRVETPLSTERTRIEDRVDARVTRDVMADGRVAIPAGAHAIGSVMLIERGGKMKERARLGVRFHTLVLADGTELPVSTEAIFREGDSPSGESARKIGGAAVGGAILGALIGGKKGAIVGGATGAAGGTAVVMAGDRNAATLPSGTILTIRLAAPVAVEVEKR